MIGDLISTIVSAPFICIGWLIVGFLAGAIARQVMGSPNASFVSDIILGLIGAFVGGLVASLLGFYKPAGGLELVLVNLVISMIGAIVLIAIGRALSGSRV
jgi:uncharacterized membrane protein YeaQ/YmgE (transglycosylase-associated protein family)